MSCTMFCLLDQDLLFWIVSSGFQKNRLFRFPFKLHLVFSNSMAEQTPEQSVYGIPDFAFNSNGWGPCSIPEQFQDLPLESFSRDDKLGMIIDINMLSGMQRLQSSTWALLWRAHA